MKYTQIPTDTFKNLQLNAGLLLDSFTPSTATIGNIIGATTGGVKFSATASFEDFGSDIDNAAKNMKELKKLTEWEAKLSGTFITLDADSVANLIGAADVDSSDSTHIIPRNDILDADFTDIWWVGDYSDVNTGTKAGFIAIHVINALSTGGFSLQSGDKAKGQYAFEYTGHYSMDAQTTVPFEVYIKAGEAA